MTFTQIKYFIEAAKCCNFRQASANLYITQQVLSKQIKALENETGIQLFERKKQRIKLTDAGNYMFSVWMPFVEGTEQALYEARNIQEKRKVRIGMIDINMLVDTVLPVLKNYSTEHADVEFEFVLGTVNKILNMFMEKELDMFISFSVDLINCNTEYQSLVLQKLKLGVISSIRHPLTKIRNLSLENIKNETICVFDDSYAKDAKRHIIDDCQKAGFTPKHIKHYDDWRNMELAIYMEQGITLTYDTYFKDTTYNLAFTPLPAYVGKENSKLAAVWYEDDLSELAGDLQTAFSYK